MLTIAEDLCMQTILPHMDPREELYLAFEYDDSRGGSIAMEITYPQGGEDPQDGADELALALIRRASPDLSWTSADGVSTITGHL